MAKEGMDLSSYLREADIKPTRFAEALGVPASTITRLLSGERSPRLDTIAKIERATGGKVTANDFLPPSPSSDERASA